MQNNLIPSRLIAFGNKKPCNALNISVLEGGV